MPTGTFLTVEQQDEIIRLYTVDLLNIPEIAARTGHHKSTVFSTLRKANVDTSQRRRRKGIPSVYRPSINDNNREAIKVAILSEYQLDGPKKIAERFNVSEKAIGSLAWRMGVRCTTGIERKNKTVAANNTSCDQSFFETWSPNLAWLLGYTWADGTVIFKKAQNHIHYRCAVQDEHIIHDIRAIIKSKSKLQRFDPPPVSAENGMLYACQPQVGFSIDSINVCRKVVESYGIPPNKSNIDPPFPNIPDEWLNHFARGAIDGDGSICRMSPGRPEFEIVLYGSHRYIEEIRMRISAASGARMPNRTSHGTSEKLSRIGWSAQSDVTRILRWMYPPGDYLKLKRKADAAAPYLVATPDLYTSSEWSE